MPGFDLGLNRDGGLTHVLDKGLGPRAWEDVLETSGAYIEVVLTLDKLDEYKRWLEQLGLTHVEISDGVIDLPRQRKLELIAELARDFTVLSEVGSKDSSVEFETDEWTQWLL